MLEHVARRAAQAALERAQAREQLVDVEGLDQVVVGAGVESGDALRDAVARAEHEHGREAAAGARAAQDLQSVHARQPEVEHQGVERALLERGQGERPAAQPLHRVAARVSASSMPAPRSSSSSTRRMRTRPEDSGFSAHRGEQRLDLLAPALVGERAVGRGGALSALPSAWRAPS